MHSCKFIVNVDLLTFRPFPLVHPNHSSAIIENIYATLHLWYVYYSSLLELYFYISMQEHTPMTHYRIRIRFISSSEHFLANWIFILFMCKCNFKPNSFGIFKKNIIAIYIHLVRLRNHPMNENLWSNSDLNLDINAPDI